MLDANPLVERINAALVCRLERRRLLDVLEELDVLDFDPV